MFGPQYDTYRDRPGKVRSERRVAPFRSVFLSRGLTSGTRIASDMDWCPVEALTVGDNGLSSDHVPQAIVAIASRGSKEQHEISALHVAFDGRDVAAPAAEMATEEDRTLGHTAAYAVAS